MGAQEVPQGEVDPRVWVEFTDPDEVGQRFRCDLTWLTSSYACIFGAGCCGIDADRPDDGCCTLGAHFSDDADAARVGAVVAELDASQWQYRDDALGPGGEGWTETDEDGDLKTRVVDGACILLNRPGFGAGAGCALHQHAVRVGVDPVTTKPDVCWQLPLRRTYRRVELPDGESYLETSIGEYERGHWGPGGHDFDWYCTRSPLAHAGGVPLFRSSAAELTELMGTAGYAELERHCEAHLLGVAAAHEAPAGARLLPLLVHPATLAAQTAPDPLGS